MAELLHFPDSFPVEALKILAPIVRDRRIEDKVAAGEAVLTLQGYAMGQFLGHDHGPNVVGSVAPPEALKLGGKPSQRAAEEALEGLEAAEGDTDPGAVRALPAAGMLVQYSMQLVRYVLVLLMAAHAGEELAMPRPVTASRLSSEVKAHFQATNEVKGPFAPIITAILSAMIPKLIEWLLSRYDVTPKSEVQAAAEPRS